MTIARITDHVAQGVALLIDQYKEKPRLEALLSSYLARVQELEDESWDVLESRFLDNAEGAQLDVLGDLVGQPRLGPSDDIYRLHIRTRIRANRSRGTSPDIRAVASLAVNGLPFSYLEFFPASFVVEVISDADPDLEDKIPFIRDVIDSARAAGVGWSLHWNEEDVEDTFAFSSTDSEEYDPDRGWGNAAGTEGGRLVGAI